MSKKGHKGHGTRLAAEVGIFFEALEPRLLLSGSWGAGADAPSADSQVSPQDSASHNVSVIAERAMNADRVAPVAGVQVDVLAQASALEVFDAETFTARQALAEALPVDATDDAATRELVIVNADVPDIERLIAGLNDNGDDRAIDIVVLDTDRDGIAQVSRILAEQTKLAAVHFVTHGAEGQIKLGNTWLDSETLQQHREAIGGWGRSLTETGDMLFYGCNVAADNAGQSLLNSMADLTHADVAASDDNTGNSQKGGDWDLEYRRGRIETLVAFSREAQLNWEGTLDTFNVNTTADTVDANPGDGLAQDASGNTSLRAAIMEANALGGADTINVAAGTYQLSHGTAGEDAATGGDLDITEDLTIGGDSAGTTTINGGALDRVFHVHQDAGNVVIEDLAITNGNASSGGGGGVLIASGVSTPYVEMTNVWIHGNQSSTSGSAITNAGDLMIQSSLITDNTAISSGTIENTAAGDLTLINTTISGNDASTRGGAIWNQGTANLEHVTITDNTAGSRGGGIAVDGGTVNIQNSIIAGNTSSGPGPDIDGAVTSGGYNVIGNTSSASGFVGTDSLDVDPMLGLLLDNGGPTKTHALQAGSPAIDPVGLTGAPNTDQRGFLRGDGSPDIGAYEVGATAATTAHYLDRFDTDASFAGDDGTLSWTNDWQEIGESSGAGGGDVQVSDEFFGDGGGNTELWTKLDKGVWREANLSGAASATLSFDYARAGLEADDHLVVYVQTAGMTGGTAIAGAPDTWDEIGRYSGIADDGAYLNDAIDISAYIAADTRIMFIAEGAAEGNDKLFIDNVRIDLAMEPASLWMSTTGNVSSSGAPGLNAWENGEVIQLADPNLAFDPGTTNGTFSSAFNLETLAGTNLDVDALHYVTRSITLGTTHTVNLQPGDVLFSTNGPETIQSLAVDRDDIMRFRPDTPGDYSSGTFAYVLRGPIGGVDLKSFSLIEQDTPFGDTTLQAGDFLFSQEVGNGNDVYVFHTVDAGNGTTAGAVELLISGGDVGITETISGLELLETNTTLGDETLAAGELLVSVDVLDSGIGTSGITADQQDIFRLQVVKTTAVTGTSVADAAVLLDGTSLSLDTGDEDVDALTVVSNGHPTATPTSHLTVTTTDDVADGNMSSVAALIDNPGTDGYISLREAIIAANATDGLNTINFNIAGSGPHIINLIAELPEITGTLTIDGTSEPDYGNAPVIGIDGAALTNDDAFRLMSGSDGSTIRGLAVTNFTDGDAFDIRTDYNTIAGNYMGLATDGLTPAGNDIGVKLHHGADFNTIGGTTSADRNLISGNSYAGVAIIDNITNDNRIIGNWIGLDQNGDVVSAGDHGVVMWDGPYNNQVGGANPGEGNRIAGHNNGVVVDDNIGADPLDNAILGNEIFSVNEMAIDLDNEQVTANDAGDGDSGPNDLLNHPVLTSLYQNGGDLEITFDLDVPAGTYRIEFFENPAGIGGIGLGEGQVFLGAVNVSHAGGGAQSFSETLNGVVATAIGSVTATATEDLGGGRYGGTSEFCAPIAQLAPVLTGANDLAPIDEDPSSNPGTLVSDLIAGQVSDPNPGALAGIAVIAVDDADGTWEYSINGGANWLAFGAIDASNARLLAADADTRVRFVPDPDWNGTVTDGLTFHAWDQTSGSNGGTAGLAATMNTVRDEFNAVDYSNNDGSTTWAGPWVEVYDDGWAGTGQVQITSGVLRLDNQDGFSEERVTRAVDLSGATTATLSFDFQILGITENPDRVRVQVSADGGTNWTTLETFFGDGPTSGSRNYDISGFATADTQIRFRISNEFLGFGEYFAVDNVEIDYTVESSGGDSAFSANAASSSITVNPVNDAPTLTAFSNVVDTTSEDTEVEITFDELRTWGDEHDIDGTVDAFVVKSVSSGTLRIGSSAATALAWAAGSNDTVDAANKAYWTPDSAANGTLAAFEVVAEDNEGAESPVPVQVDVEVTSVNNAPTLAGGPFTLPATDEDTTSAGTQVATILSGLTTGDGDGDTLGLAIEVASGNGSWQYSIDSTDGSNGSWTDFGPVNGSSALLLANSSWVRYQPDLLNGEIAEIIFHAWDGSTDSASTTGTPAYANPGAGGGSTAFSFGVAQATLTVTDLDDVPVITGDVSGSVTEDAAATLTVSGDLDAGGGDAGEDLFNAETLTGTYGDLTVTAAGGWIYTADNSQAAIQALALSDTLTESFTVTNADGVTTQTVTITIDGIDDVPVITGDVSGSVTEDDAATLTVSGDLDASGGDAGEDLFNAETLTGTYGGLTVTAAGGWTYSADNSQAAIQALGASDTLTESFTVTNADDATITVLTITINGSNDSAMVSSASQTLTETDAALSTSGTLTSTDVDNPDDTFTPDTIVGTIGTFTIDAAGAWTFTANSPFDHLNVGDNVSETFNVTSVDGTAGTVTIQIDGSNDAATVSSDSRTLTETDVALTTSGTLTSSDVDDPDDTFTADTINGTIGTFTIDGAGNWAFTANSPFDHLNVGDNVSETFNVTSVDGTAGTVTIQIDGSNDAATVSSDSRTLTETDVALTTSGTLTSSDVDDPDDTFTADTINGTIGTFTIDAAGAWTFTANSAFDNLNVGDNVSETFNVTSVDGTAGTVTIQIDGSNDAATVSSDSRTLTETDVALTTSGTLTSSDVDDPDDTFTADTINGTIGTFTIDGAGNWAFTANSPFDHLNVGDNVSETFNVTSVDGTAGTVTIQIDGSNDAAITSPVTLTAIAEDSGARTITQAQLLANASDVDGPALSAANLAISAGAGTLVDNGDGTWDYTPAADDDTAVSFSYTISDGSASVAGSATLDITPVNDAPTTSPVTLTAIAEDSGARTITQAQLLANAADVDGPALTAANLAISAGAGTLADNGDGTWDYTPAADDDTAVSFSYTISDGSASVAGSATLDITPVNDAPTTSPVTLTPIAEDSGARTITQAQLLANASDVDGPALSATNLAISAGAGSLVDNGDGTWDYTPAADDDTAVSFSYTISDGTDTVAGSATLDITPLNDAPTSMADSFAVDEGASANLNLAANDSDADDGLDLASIAIVTGPTYGSVVSNGDGTVDYTHDGSENFTDSFTYTIDDNSGVTSNTVTVDLTITPVNDNDPVADDESFSVAEGGTATEANLDAGNSLLDGDMDSDLPHDTLTVNTTPVAGPSHGSLTLNADGTFTYTHDGSETMTDSFTYELLDADGGVSDTATVTISITPVNDAPNVTLVNTMTAIAFDADTSASIKVADIVITDDAAGTNNLALGGADGAMFAIVGGNELHLRAGSILDAAANPNLDVTVAVDDTSLAGTPDATATLRIVVAGPSSPQPPAPPIGPDPVDPPGPEPGPETETPPPPEEPAEAPEEEAGEAEAPPAPEPVAEGTSRNNKAPIAERSFRARDDHPWLAEDDLVDGVDPAEEGAGTEAAPPQPVAESTIAERLERFVRVHNLTSARAYLNLLNTLNSVKDEMTGDIAFNRTVLGSAIAVSTGLSIGYVVWLIRGGMLLSTLLSSLPAWQILDPLPILARKDEDAEDDDDESLESMLKRRERSRESKESRREGSAGRPQSDP